MAEPLVSATTNLHTSASSGASQTPSSAPDWDGLSEVQKQQTFALMPPKRKQGLSYTEWLSQGYQHTKENWMPWIEDVYLKWFTNDNKASYATKGNSPSSTLVVVRWKLIWRGYVDALDKSKITGIDQVDSVQGSVNEAVGKQVGKGGLLQPLGDLASKEGVNRAERGGKDEKGCYIVATDAGEKSGYLSAAGDYAASAGNGVWSGAKSAGGYVRGMFGAGEKKEDK